jgi:hypothetical protein
MSNTSRWGTVAQQTLPDVLLDEAETSLRASFTSLLSPKDREDLVEDARDRLIQWLALRQHEGETDVQS